MLLGFAQPLPTDWLDYLTVPRSAGSMGWALNGHVWTEPDHGGGMFDTGWVAQVAGAAHVSFLMWPLIGPQIGTPLLNSGSGQSLSPVTPANVATPTVMTLADVTAGVWDAMFTAGFTNIAAYVPDATFRLGQESYGPGWWAWGGSALGAAYKATFQHLVTLARGISPAFTFEWNGAAALPNVNGYSVADVADFYPGDGYVDYISADPYDTNDTLPGQRGWDYYVTQMTPGLDLARAHGKPYCLAEWGIQNFAQTGHGHDDDWAYVQAAYQWMRANAASLGYVHFFQNPPSVFTNTPWQGCLQDNPQSAALFRALFGAWAHEIAGTTLPRFVTPGFGPIGAVSAVGTFAHASGTARKTLDVTPTAVGDVLVLSILNLAIDTAVSAVTGGGVTTWHKIVNANPGITEGDTELWYGVVTTVGAATITVTDLETSQAILGCQQFSVGTPATWAVDTSAASVSTSAATSGNYPSVTPAGRNELYVGTALLIGGGVSGGTAGFNYLSGSFGGYEPNAQFVYQLVSSTPTACAPAWTQTSGKWSAVSALLTASPVTPGLDSHRLRLS